MNKYLHFYFYYHFQPSSIILTAKKVRFKFQNLEYTEVLVTYEIGYLSYINIKSIYKQKLENYEKFIAKSYETFTIFINQYFPFL